MSDSITITATVTELGEGGDGKPNFGVSVKNNSEGNYVGSIADTLARILFALSKQAAGYVGSSNLRAAWEVLKEEVSEQVEEEIERTEAQRIPLSTIEVLQVLFGETSENRDEDSESLIPEIGESVDKLTAEIVSALPMGARFRDDDGDHFVRVEDGILLVTRSGLEGEPNSSSEIFGPYTRVEETEVPRYGVKNEPDTTEEIPRRGETVNLISPELIDNLPLGARFIDRDQDIWTKVSGGMKRENSSTLWSHVRYYGPYTRIKDLRED